MELTIFLDAISGFSIDDDMLLSLGQEHANPVEDVISNAIVV